MRATAGRRGRQRKVGRAAERLRGHPADLSSCLVLLAAASRWRCRRHPHVDRPRRRRAHHADDAGDAGAEAELVGRVAVACAARPGGGRAAARDQRRAPGARAAGPVVARASSSRRSTRSRCSAWSRGHADAAARRRRQPRATPRRRAAPGPVEQVAWLALPQRQRAARRRQATAQCYCGCSSGSLRASWATAR